MTSMHNLMISKACKRARDAKLEEQDARFVKGAIEAARFAQNGELRPITIGKRLALESVNMNGTNLYFHDRYADDYDVVMAAVINNGMALTYASERLKQNKEVVLAAVKNTSTALTFVSKQLLHDDEFMKLLIDITTEAYGYASYAIKNNKEITLGVVQKNGIMLFQASFEMRKDQEVVEAAVQNCPRAIEYSLR